MATISIEVKQATKNGDQSLRNDPNSAVLITPPRGKVGSYLRTAEAFPVQLTDGAATVQLSPTGPGQAYQAEELWPGGEKFYFVVTGDQAYVDLVRVDPRTLTQEPPEPAWAAALEALQDLIGSGGGGGSVPAASTTTAGIAELATNAEAVTGTDTTRIVTPAGVKAVIAALVNGAGTSMDTLRELAAAIGDDPNFAQSITTALAERALRAWTPCVVIQSGASYPTPPAGHACYSYRGTTDPASLGITLNPFDEWIGTS